MSILPVIATGSPLFFTKMHFWYGVFIALGIGTAAQALWAKRLRAWWTKRRNFTWFILGRPEAPGVPGSAILPASERLGGVEKDLKAQHQDIKRQGEDIKESKADIKSQGVDIQEIKGLLKDVNNSLKTALSIAANTNLKVTANGGNTDSAPDVLQRMAKKMGVWEHDGVPPISVANVIDLYDVLSTVHPEGASNGVPPHHHDVAVQSGEVATQDSK